HRDRRHHDQRRRPDPLGRRRPDRRLQSDGAAAQGREHPAPEDGRAARQTEMSPITEIGGKHLPFLRWSFWRFLLGARSLLTNWQGGDGREEALAQYVAANARKGDLDDAIRAVDEFCYRRAIMMNVGDEKGELLDRAVARAQPQRLLELGTYCGYSALRTARAMPPGAHLTSIEFSAA